MSASSSSAKASLTLVQGDVDASATQDAVAGHGEIALGDAAATPYPAAMKYFREEFEAAVSQPVDERFDPSASYVFSKVGA